MKNRDQDCEEFMAFCAEFGDAAAISILEEIADATWKGQNTDTVRITETHRYDACNATHEGEIEFQGKRYGFVLESGNNRGDVMHQWSSEGVENVCIGEQPRPTQFTFVPKTGCTPAMARVWVFWTTEKWFEDKVRGYNYDRHFAPGHATESHYRAFAESKGMTIGTEEDAKRWEEFSKQDNAQYLKDIAEMAEGLR